ncbi:MAG TPA: transcription factor [Polyangiaceae bacterium]|nr:transcription factor [Polyangiaceae bacterium]
MAVPTLTGITPATGPTGGGDIVRLTGTGFGPRVAVLFGDVPAEVLSLRVEAGLWLSDVRTPAHPDAVVDVTLRNLDAAGAPVPGEETVLTAGYRFLRPRIVNESDLTRLVRKLLRDLKRQVIENSSITVSVDYDDTTIDGLNVVAISKLPSLVLSGPRVAENRFFSTNEPHQDVVPGAAGPELMRRRPPYTVDLLFTLTAASDRTVELLNLMAAVATFLNRNRWIAVPRDPDDAGAGEVRWEMDPVGDFQTRLDGPDDVRVFTCGFVVRGFDLDEGLPLDVGKAVAETELETDVIAPGGAP